jgi:hypothetical protein
MGNESIKKFIVNHLPAYGAIAFIYLGLAIRYSIYLWTFDCDGFGCLSILFFTGPLTLVFIINFLWTIFRLLQMRFAKGLKEKDQRTVKFKAGLDSSFLLMTLFTFLLILRLI